MKTFEQFKKEIKQREKNWEEKELYKKYLISELREICKCENYLSINEYHICNDCGRRETQ